MRIFPVQITVKSLRGELSVLDSIHHHHHHHHYQHPSTRVNTVGQISSVESDDKANFNTGTQNKPANSRRAAGRWSSSVGSRYRVHVPCDGPSDRGEIIDDLIYRDVPIVSPPEAYNLGINPKSPQFFYHHPRIATFWENSPEPSCGPLHTTDTSSNSKYAPGQPQMDSTNPRDPTMQKTTPR